MEDHEVVEAFASGAKEAFGPTLHVEGDVLYLGGWWHASVRVDHDAFILRRDDPPEPSSVLDEAARVFTERALQDVGEHPLIEAVTYTEISVAGATWSLWAPDRAEAEAALARRAGAESVPRDWTPDDAALPGDFNVELEGARRMAGLGGNVVLTVGLDPERVTQLKVALPEARFEARAFDEIAPHDCGEVHAGAIVVDATERRGREFIMELRAAACGRFLPVLALGKDADPPPGADVALGPDAPPTRWREELVRFLP